jgi:hypothetical protein
MHLRGAVGGPFAPSPSLVTTAVSKAAHPASSGSPGARSPTASPTFSQALRTAMGAAAGRPAARGGGDRERSTSGGGGGGAEELDAAARHLAHLGPPAAPASGLEAPIQPLTTTLLTQIAPAPSVAAGPGPSSSLEEILPGLVRKIAWSGDARRGAVRIELGAGALAGATLLVASDGGRVQVTLSARSDVELEPWRERIAARLADRGLDADVA